MTETTDTSKSGAAGGADIYNTATSTTENPCSLIFTCWGMKRGPHGAKITDGSCRDLLSLREEPDGFGNQLKLKSAASEETIAELDSIFSEERWPGNTGLQDGMKRFVRGDGQAMDSILRQVGLKAPPKFFRSGQNEWDGRNTEWAMVRLYRD